MEDWRLTNQMNYLHKAVLKPVTSCDLEATDHEHCEFCFEKFGSKDGWLKEGYCTTDGYHWICKNCFEDFCKEFEWTIV
ncbi:MAG: hypothetical protein IKV52_03480 [Oscillospiraceae bacterium]|nr:hypothetical protein [Oscillospiraceae bacterium]